VGAVRVDLAGSGEGRVAVAMPAFRRGQKLAFSFDEDELTLAWDAVRAAGLAHRTAVRPVGLQVPEWWWRGTGLQPDEAAPLRLESTPTTRGPAVTLHAQPAAPDVEPASLRLYGAAPARPEAEWQRHRIARDAPDTEADHPLGAYVTAPRHEQVTALRMRLGPGVVRSWTQVGAGAAPTEFLRFQEAVGAYHVVLVEGADGTRTVGLWAGAVPPRTGDRAEPALRRLYRTQGAWRHGIKFLPPAGAAPP
jgi:hypothetical protein